MSEPLVSVVLIFLNARRYLTQAVESVFAQTHTNWELLLVDDGSTDESSEIARGYARQFPARVSYLQHDGGANRGMSASRNLGIRDSTGEFVAFIDSDDLWLPHKLARQLALIDANPAAGMICGPTLWWHSWTGDPGDLDHDAQRELRIGGDRLYSPPELLRAFVLKQARTPATCSVLLRRAAIECVGGFEDHFRGMYEDQAFFVKIYRHVTVYVSTECLDYYRQHPESHCSVADREGPSHFVVENRDRQRFFSWLASYVREDDILGSLISVPPTI